MMNKYISAAVYVLAFPASSFANPTVTGNVLTWPNDGWYQVQRADTFATICEGSITLESSLTNGPCILGSGNHIVINHSTGTRFENIIAEEIEITEPVNGVVVNGNQIRWPDDGWYQVQNASTFQSVCEGGRECTVSNGTYVVINHTTSTRFNDIVVGTTAGNNNDRPTSIEAEGNTIRWPDDGWHQVQNADTFVSVCEGGSECEVPDGRYVVINHTTGVRQPLDVLSNDNPQNPPSQNTITVDFDIFVPVHRSNELLVTIEWDNNQAQAAWQVDEFWTATGEFAADEDYNVLVSFFDRNGEITLGTFEASYSPGLASIEEDFDIFSVDANDFDTAVWDDDSDGISNIDELRRGTDPFVANESTSLASFDMPAVANNLVESLAGFQLDQLSVLVDDMDFIVQQTTTRLWPNDDWYEVQNSRTFATVCAGQFECVILPGSYLVVNHSTGARELIDVPFVDPAEHAHAIQLPSTTFIITDDLFQWTSANVDRRKYNCEGGGTMINETVFANPIKVANSDTGTVDRRGYLFDQCRVIVRDGLVPDGTYLLNGSVLRESRLYAGFSDHREIYNYDGFSLIGDNGLEYRVSGNTEHYEHESWRFIDRRTATISEYQKTSTDGQIAEQITDGFYDFDNWSASGDRVYSFEVSGTIRNEHTADQSVVITNDPIFTLDRHTADPSNYDHPAEPFNGSMLMVAEDGGTLTTTANPDFVNPEDQDVFSRRTLYTDVEHLAADGSWSFTDGVTHFSPSVSPIFCTSLHRLSRLPETGRLECTSRSARWWVDNHGRGSFSLEIFDRDVALP